MAGRIQESVTPLGKWLRSQELSITQFAKDIGACYRTVWLAVHGYRVSYETAAKICQYVGKGVPGIDIKNLCSAIPRTEFEPAILE